MKKIPYGLQNFESIITENYYYVDKTRFIEQLENLNEKYPVFLRPRKFGKSLWVVMLGYYYDVRHKDKFDKLFGGLYIGKNPTPLRNSYYILNFDFSGISTRTDEQLLKSFKINVYGSISLFIALYKLEYLNIDISENDDPAAMLSKLFLAFSKADIPQKIYLIIDEYDHFANELLGFRLSSFKEVISRTGFVRKFFEEIKKAVKLGIDRIFITGVSPITLDSMTSGFNIANNITLDENFNEMLGFNETEVTALLNEYNYDNSLLNEMRRCYNGYQFSKTAANKVYNSDMVLYFLNEYGKGKCNPDEIVDPNISSDYKKIQKLIELNSDYKSILEDVLNNENLPVNITREFNLEKEQMRDDFLSLMFYLGYLTIRKSNPVETVLGAPNYGIQLLYYDYFAMLLKIETRGINEVIKEIAFQGKIDKLTAEVNKVLKTLSKICYGHRRRYSCGS